MPVSSTLHLSADLAAVDGVRKVVILGRKAALADSEVPGRLGVSGDTWSAVLAATEPRDGGASATTWVGDVEIVAGVLPEQRSRHNSPSRAWAIPGLAAKARGRRDAALVLELTDPAHAAAAVTAAARAFPLFHRGSGEVHQQQVAVVLPGLDSLDSLEPLVAGVRLAARLFDMPTAELHTDAFVEEATAVAEQVGAEVQVIRGTELRDQGFGGLWGVGKAATRPPALVCLTHRPPGATRHVAWVGKGIVYDTGGLSIKSKSGMPGMKGDMGGAAAVLGAFQVAGLRQVDYAITAVLCLAENAVGPDATRPDDILQLRSGKTVEINNTDAEGRLVLGDGVAWVCEAHQPDLVIDLATLTGAALVATGKNHAAVVSNDALVETEAIVAGLDAGEPVHPLLYAPELFRKEFKSQVADMRNSVKDRANAQTSCAAQFVANHLPDPAPRWLHVDLAGPAWRDNGRGSGYGVGFLLGFGCGPDPI